MLSPARVTRSLCTALLAAALLAGCGGAEKGGADGADGGTTDGAKSAADAKPSAASAADRAYYGCLEKNGVTIETTADGELRVAKTGGDQSVLTKAEAKCADLLPAHDTTADEGDPAKADPAFGACMKAEGFTTYDRSKSGDNDALVAALKKCSAGKGADDVVVGG
ncbi:hypothetical protein [Streptomyces sp. NPDC049813]|uniref:hypothetical protein n=1 Tax=Streptomyces sp. NPDC049813 TaxID=3365597 RepID=UPI0037B73214